PRRRSRPRARRVHRRLRDRRCAHRRAVLPRRRPRQSHLLGPLAVLALALAVGLLAIVAAFALGIWFDRRAAANTAPTPPPAPPPVIAPTSTFIAIEPAKLPKFADLGGMSELKAELTDTLELLLATTSEAAAYHVAWNGVLLYGPPGVGKTMAAHATAGQ